MKQLVYKTEWSGKKTFKCCVDLNPSSGNACIVNKTRYMLPLGFKSVDLSAVTGSPQSAAADGDLQSGSDGSAGGLSLDSMSSLRQTTR